MFLKQKWVQNKHKPVHRRQNEHAGHTLTLPNIQLTCLHANGAKHEAETMSQGHTYKQFQTAGKVNPLTCMLF